MQKLSFYIHLEYLLNTQSYEKRLGYLLLMARLLEFDVC